MRPNRLRRAWTLKPQYRMIRQAGGKGAHSITRKPHSAAKKPYHKETPLPDSVLVLSSFSD